VHCTARVANCILKRLDAQALLVEPALQREVRKFRSTLAWGHGTILAIPHTIMCGNCELSDVFDAQQLPLKDRLAPRLTKPGELDLSTANLFVRNTVYHTNLVELVTKYSRGRTIP
jgi:hypothetical protein